MNKSQECSFSETCGKFKCLASCPDLIRTSTSSARGEAANKVVDHRGKPGDGRVGLGIRIEYDAESRINVVRKTAAKDGERP